MASKSSAAAGSDPRKGTEIARATAVDQAGPKAGQQPIRSEELLQGGREVQILHAGEVYRLTLTRAGKLILHK